MESPPKRVTRARAAAKQDDTGIKTTKIATAASKAKLSRTAAATTKRKTRTEDEDIDENNQLDGAPEHVIEPEITVAAKSTRGRPKRAAAAEQEDQEVMEATTQPVKVTRGRAARAESEQIEDAPAATKVTRGRPKKVVESSAPEPARATRGRPKKIEVPAEEGPIVVEGARKTRGRAATLTKPAAPKKTVKFEEPDKENVIPITAKGKAKATEVASGLRAKPVRKPAPTARATRGRPKAEEKTEGTTPLSPKKVTQVGALPKEVVSEDELAVAEKTPMKPLTKSPVKPPGSIFNTAKKLDFSSNSISVHRMTTQDFSGSVMASPARRPPQSPFKESMKTSPQRTNFQGSMMQSPFRPNLPAPKTSSQNPSFKASLLQSPARRPTSPMKVNDAGSPSRTNKGSLFESTNRATPFKLSRFATPRTLNIGKSVSREEQMIPPPSAPPKFVVGTKKISNQDETAATEVEPQLKFSGRLSSIMPRSADPALSGVHSARVVIPDDEIQHSGSSEIVGADQCNTIVVEDPMDTATTTPPVSPPRHSTGSFELRKRDESPFDDSSDSEDELASGSLQYSPLPIGGLKVSGNNFASSPLEFQSIRTPQPQKSLRRSSAAVRSEKRERIGFTPLAIQLGNWMASSPEKPEAVLEEPSSPTHLIQAPSSSTLAEQSPCKNTFFDDEMLVRDEIPVTPPTPAVTSIESAIEEAFGPVELDEIDVGLADEADEMSLLEPEQVTTCDVEDMFDVMELESLEPGAIEMEIPQLIENEIKHDETLAGDAPAEELIEVIDPTIVEPALSEASQEYGDENAIPVDPALLEPQATTTNVLYSTPRRILTERTFHTVSKVPLKPAAEDTPMRPSPMKRSASISKLPVQRPSSTLTRKNTVISYSPVKSTPRQKTPQKATESESSPSKTEWSTIGTPARTPRRDLDATILKGAVVFVDVHTTEGADASVLFTELLTQMGARCVKSWNWNGNGDDGNKIGITHVVFKDGGKRTLEKARETGGLVSCVGVGWVLDCERENQWLPESPYAVDTALVPRGGHRRRKSMEPRALANMNGTIVSSTPSRSTSLNMTPAKEPATMALGTPMTSKSRRRDSVQWVRSPASASPQSTEDAEDFLSPVPATPAPGVISAYGEEGLMGETPGGQTPYFLHKEHLVQKTAPVNRFVDDDEQKGAGLGWLSEKKDESVMVRLMAARRKSLQWAPKVGSPLAKGEGWKGIA